MPEREIEQDGWPLSPNKKALWSLSIGLYKDIKTLFEALTEPHVFKFRLTPLVSYL